MLLLSTFSGVRNWFSLRCFFSSIYTLHSSALHGTRLRFATATWRSSYALLASLRFLRRTSSTLETQPTHQNKRIALQIDSVVVLVANQRHDGYQTQALGDSVPYPSQETDQSSRGQKKGRNGIQNGVFFWNHSNRTLARVEMSGEVIDPQFMDLSSTDVSDSDNASTPRSSTHSVYVPQVAV